jgi:predicted alpha/beta superfamily hydrolase
VVHANHRGNRIFVQENSSERSDTDLHQELCIVAATGENKQDSVEYPEFQKSKVLVRRQQVKLQRGHYHVDSVYKLRKIAMPPAPVVQLFIKLGAAKF